MRRAARVDGNHGEIVSALRAIGASVYDASAVGGGFPDLVVGLRGVTLLVEVKNPKQPPSKRRLKPLQQQFHAAWRGSSVMVVETPEAAIELVMAAVNRGFAP